MYSPFVAEQRDWDAHVSDWTLYNTNVRLNLELFPPIQNTLLTSPLIV